MKKYLRRIGALLLSFIMVLSMCTSVFAAIKDKATITVNNAEGATLTYARVIEPDQTTETGWNFVNNNVAKAYAQAFGVYNENDLAKSAQDAIKAMIPKSDVNAEMLGAAQAAAAGAVTFGAMASPQEVDVAGVYLIKAVDKTDETSAASVKYTYNIMAAYVGFGEVTIETDGTKIKYDYPSLEDTTVEAKRTPISVTKIVDDSDNVTRTGAVLTYTVRTNVPFIAPTDTDRTFFVYDELTGAEYTETATAKITLAGADNDITSTHPISFNKANTGFSVDLSDLIDDANSKAGQEIVITYKVKVTSENDIITNIAKAGHENGEQYGSTTINTYEGKITLNKIDEKDKKALAGAEFEVRKDSKDSDALNFIKLEDGSYKFVDEKNQDSTTQIVTDKNGTAIVRGLDRGTYWFKEIKAPTGYSVNTTDVSAILELNENNSKNGAATAVLTAGATMKDTKLSELPSTGGIGTYIFTITGVLIMAGVAGMFIISRRKEHE